TKERSRQQRTLSERHVSQEMPNIRRPQWNRAAGQDMQVLRGRNDVAPLVLGQVSDELHAPAGLQTWLDDDPVAHARTELPQVLGTRGVLVNTESKEPGRGACRHHARTAGDACETKR